VEDCQNISGREEAMRTIHRAICDFAGLFELPVPHIEEKNPEGLLRTTLIRWSELVAPQALVILFDEVDVLADDALISFLRQLRGGFVFRGAGKFPVSIALVGMQDLRDYIIATKDGEAPNPGSPFNIKADSAVLSNFHKADVAKLFAQRTAETGQEITQEALDYVYEQSQGQPWIVNSLFMRATQRVLDEESRETVTLEHVRQGRQQMINARETHLDSLGERLRDPKIKHVIQTIITGDVDPTLGRIHPDVELAMDLGLISWSSSNGFTIANPVYEEILIRYLNSGYHDSLPALSSWQWQNAKGDLDMDRLLREFQKFWRRHSEIWEQKADYTEAFPHLLLMAFLQRILNGGGRIERESAAGRGRMDLAVEYRNYWYIIEVKILHSYDSSPIVREEGLEQIREYRDKIDQKAPAYLIIFDRRKESKLKSWDERIGWEQVKDVTIVSA
jgi:hypothetical protein